jgi:hypothetical protein
MEKTMTEEKKNDLTPYKPNNVVPAQDVDPFLEYALSEGAIDGKFLLFKKGDWVAGEGKEPVALGTRYVAIMSEALRGWVHWYGGKVTERRIGRVVDRFRPPPRETLGDTDVSAWEVSPQGPKDPWALTAYLGLRDSGDEGEKFVFSTASVGGHGAFRKLSEAYGRRTPKNRNKLPVVEIGTGSYPHEEWGKVLFPTFKIVGWVDDPDAPATAAMTQPVTPVLDDAIPF